MRSRLVVLLSLVVLLVCALSPVVSAAPLDLAQAESESEGGGSTDDSGPGEEGGEGDPESEVGADEGQEGATEEEEGPQWTYQMSRITLVMLLLLFLAMGALYYRMIAKRQRGA